MYVKNLKLHGVGKFDEPVQFQFVQGLNLLTGKNEAGKSTIAKAIETSLFGFKPMKDWKYANWNQQETVIECMLSQKNEETLITRRYGSKIRGTTLSGHVAENIGNQPIEGHLIDLELYKSMFSIGIDELASIDKKSWKELTASLTDSYNHSAFKSAAETQETVDQKASEIYKENGRGQFEMKRIQEDQDAVSAQLKQLEIERAYSVRSEEELKVIKRQIEQIHQEILQIDQKIRFYEDNHQCIRRRREYRQKIADYQQILDLGLPDKRHVERWLLEFERERLITVEMDRIRTEIQAIREKKNEEETRWKSSKKPFLKKRVILSAFIAASILSFVIYSFPKGFNELEQVIIGILVVLDAAVLMNVGFVGNKMKRKELGSFDQKMGYLNQNITLLEKQLHRYEDEFEEMQSFQKPLKVDCERLGMSGPQEIMDWLLKLNYLKNGLNALLEQEEDPEAFLTTINLADGVKEPEEIGLKVLLDQRDYLVQTRTDQEQKLAHNTNLSVKEIDYRLNELSEKHISGHQQLMESAFKRDRLMLVSKIVAEAEKMYRKSQKPDFLIKASRYMKLLSNSKYEEILMSEVGGFILRSQNELIPMSETISRGTKEQMYLALKLAMTFRLDPLGYYPILMDEIAVNFDKARRQGLFNVLKELSEHRQILYLTCHDWFVEELNNEMDSHLIILD